MSLFFARWAGCVRRNVDKLVYESRFFALLVKLRGFSLLKKTWKRKDIFFFVIRYTIWLWFWNKSKIVLRSLYWERRSHRLPCCESSSSIFLHHNHCFEMCIDSLKKIAPGLGSLFQKQSKPGMKVVETVRMCFQFFFCISRNVCHFFVLNSDVSGDRSSNSLVLEFGVLGIWRVPRTKGISLSWSEYRFSGMPLNMNSR